MSRLGDLIRTERIRQKLTPKQVAKKTGVSESYLLAVGDDELIKIHYHTNEPWKVLEYCASLGEIYDVVVENMERQEQGLKG